MAAQPKVPEFKNKMMCVSQDGSLSDLENTDLETELKTNMGGSSFVNIKTAGSASSLQKNSDATFIVKI